MEIVLSSLARPLRSYSRTTHPTRASWPTSRSTRNIGIYPTSTHHGTSTAHVTHTTAHATAHTHVHHTRPHPPRPATKAPRRSHARHHRVHPPADAHSTHHTRVQAPRTGHLEHAGVKLGKCLRVKGCITGASCDANAWINANPRPNTVTEILWLLPYKAATSTSTLR